MKSDSKGTFHVATTEDMQKRYTDTTEDPSPSEEPSSYTALNVTVGPKVGAKIKHKLKDIDHRLSECLQNVGMMAVYMSRDTDRSLATYVSARRGNLEQQLGTGSTGFSSMKASIVTDRQACENLKDILGDIDSLLQKRELGRNALCSLSNAYRVLSLCSGCLATLCTSLEDDVSSWRKATKPLHSLPAVLEKVYLTINTFPSTDTLTENTISTQCYCRILLSG